MPEPTSGTLHGTGGLRLHWRSWAPEERARGVVVVAHGAAEHGGRYGHLVDVLVPAGFAVYALDQRGHGRSEGRRAYVERLDRTVTDLDRMVEVAVDEHHGAPVFVLGHSMGGCVAILHALAHGSRLAGLVLSAPLAVIEGPAPLRALVHALSAVAPRAGVHRVDSSGISRDPAEVAAYDSDPLVYRGRLPARTISELLRATDSFPERLPRLALPLLVVHGTADRIVPVAAARLVHDRAGSADKTLELYEGYFHEMHNEAPEHRTRPLGDVLEWLRARAPAA